MLSKYRENSGGPSFRSFRPYLSKFQLIDHEECNTEILMKSLTFLYQTGEMLYKKKERAVSLLISKKDQWILLKIAGIISFQLMSF